MVTTSDIDYDSRILNEAESLAQKYDVTILCRKYPHESFLRPQKFIIKRIDYRKLSIYKLNIFSSLFSLIKAAFKENTDIYHAHDLDGLLCAFPAALLRRKILVYDSHELWSDTYPFGNLRGIQWLLGPLEKFLMMKVRAGITVNDSIAKFLRKKYQKNFISLRNIPDSFLLRKAKTDLKKLFPHQKIVLHLGAADEGRGMEQMIEAAKYFSQDMVLVFLGGGKTEKQAQEIVLKYNLRDRVHFLPPIPPAEIISTIKSADLGLALTQNLSKSYYYSLPNKLFQYIAANIPILGSNFPEYRKIIIQNKIGEVADPSKPELIARETIKMLTKENQKKYRHNLASLAKTRYNWNIEKEKLFQFYNKIN